MYGAGREDDRNFEDECQARVAKAEAAFPCFRASCEAEATIDCDTSARRLYRAFKSLTGARPFMDTDADEYCRLIDRRTQGRSLLQMLTDAGFAEATFHGWTGYRTSSLTQGGLVTARKPVRRT